MSEEGVLPRALSLDGNSDLETVLAAWHEATVRLERTHEALRAEVRRLTDELEVKNRELARKNRMADLGQMATHIAYEVRNNLVPVTLYLSLLRRRIKDDSGSLDVLEKVEAGFAALDVTVNDLLHFTADRDPQLQTFPLENLVEEVCVSLASQLSAQGIEVVTEVGRQRLVTADREMLRRGVLNLVLNAVDAMPEGGTLTVTASDAERGVKLTVADTGPGMSEETVRRALEPFYTTKPGGTGLGLTIVCRIAEMHGGKLVCTGGAEKGASFTLSLPHKAQENAA